ncbi:MAG: aspartate kinase [Conexivisphaerales archaeon]
MSNVKFRKVVVLKFGGSVLDSQESILQASNIVRRLHSEGIATVVVVSALKGVTDQLVHLAKSVDPAIDPEVLDELLASGEKTSARLFSAALSAQGVKSVVVDPETPYWPIYTDDNHTDANPLVELTREKCTKNLLPLLNQGNVPVVCGFIGKTVNGRITTMGRGGSDTTAVLLANCLNADEAILIKDVDGVYTTDPDKVKEAVKVDTLSGEEAEMLAASGAKFLQLKALRYQNGVKLRVTSLDKLDSGTVIRGDVPEINVEIITEGIRMVSVVGARFTEEELAKILSVLRECGASLLAFSFEKNGVVLYVSEGEDVVNRLHELIVKQRIGKALSFFDDLAMISVSGSRLETQKGVIQRVTQPLAREGINLYGLITMLSSVKLFVASRQVESAKRLVQEAMMVSAR